MLSFIRKRLPSKDHDSDHQISKAEERSKHKIKPGKMVATPKSTVDELVIHPNVSSNATVLNQSHSDVDYLPMMSGRSAGVRSDQHSFSNPDSPSDCYVSPSDTTHIERDANDVQTPAARSRVLDSIVAMIPNDAKQTNNKRR